MNIIGIVGWKNTGKTTLIEKLISEFNRRGLSISTIKNSHHNVSLDKEGSDSFKHFKAGAADTILTTEKMWVKFSRGYSNSENRLKFLIQQVSDVDIVIVEGFKKANHKKIEVVNRFNGKKPIFLSDKAICGLVYDQETNVDSDLPQFNRDDVKKICDFIQNIFSIK